LSKFTGPNLLRYETSLCKRCFGCQRMEQDDFVPQTKCRQAILTEKKPKQIKINLSNKSARIEFLQGSGERGKKDELKSKRSQGRKRTCKETA
jgi:hypothetical protein